MKLEIRQRGRMASKIHKFGELQPTLAIGHNGSRSLVLRPWNGGAERAIAALRDKMGPTIKSRPLLFLSTILAVLVVRFGDTELWKRNEDGVYEPQMTEADRLFFFDNAWLQDVQMAFFFARREAHGSEFKFASTLPGAPGDEQIRVDLDECEVTIVDELADSLLTHKFSAPMLVRNETASGCVIGPARWGALTSLCSTNSSALAYAAIFSSVHQIPGTKIRQPVAADFDELPRSEIRRLASATDATSVGLDLSIQVDTDQGGVHTASVQWLDPSFFSDSSPSKGYVRSGRMNSRLSTGAASPKMSAQ